VTDRIELQQARRTAAVRLAREVVKVDGHVPGLIVRYVLEELDSVRARLAELEGNGDG
jgi:hypothetical protein